MNKLPAFKRQGIELEPPKHPLVYAGKMCQCGGVLYKKSDGVIICKNCPHPLIEKKIQ